MTPRPARSYQQGRRGRKRPGPYHHGPPPMGMFGPPPPGGPHHIGGPGGPGGPGRHNQRFMVTHHSFDPLMAEQHFGSSTVDTDDADFKAALVKKTQELTPSTTEQSSVQNLVTKVETVLEGLILSPVGLDIPVDEVRTVGSYKKGTLLAGHPVADLVVILKETPSTANIENLANKVQENLKANTKTEEFPTQANEGGFNTTSSEGALVRVLVTTLPKHLFSVDTEKHVDVKLLEGALATIRHARWFEENASHTAVRVLVRLLKDLKKRFTGLAGLTPWLIDLLAFKSATLPSNTRDPLPISVAFRRSLQLLAAGCFLPGAIGVVDPCESGQVRAHSVLGLEEQDMLCSTAQTLLRTLAHGAYNEILGVEGQPSVALDTDITSWGGTIVTPGQPAYNKEEHKKETMEDEKEEEQPITDASKTV